MDATVLVPSKLRDMEMMGRKKMIMIRVPPALANTDLYSFYLMLNEVKKELLWGPGTGAVAAATMGSTPHVGSGSSSVDRSSPRDSSASGLSSSGGSSSGFSSSASGSSASSASSHLLHLNSQQSSSPFNTTSSSSVSSSSTITRGTLTNGTMHHNHQTTTQHVRQPSDDSLGSLGSSSTASSSEPDTDSEVDSLLTDRDSNINGSSGSDEHTSHLAAAFRHHLQGLHTILHQLADSADYLSSRYQEEIDASSL